MSDELEELSANSIKAKTIATALGDKIPIDAMGYPIGKSTTETAKAIRPPLGVSNPEWLTALEVATEYFRLTSGMVQPTREALSAASALPPRVWRTIYHKDNVDNWHAALAIKGILKKGSGLTFDQLRALRFLTDVTARGDLNSRLRKLGISWEQFQNWQKDPKFAEQLKMRSEDILNEAEPLVTMQVVRGAVEGNMKNIEYYHKMTGKFQPEDKQMADFRAFIVGLMEILQYEIEDKEQLRRIAGRLQALRDKTLGEENGTVHK